MTFQLGDRVLVKAALWRERGESSRIWVRTEFDIPQAGIVVGARTKVNGRMETEGDYESYSSFRYFSPYTWIPTILVATDMRKSHLVCMPDDVELAP